MGLAVLHLAATLVAAHTSLSNKEPRYLPKRGKAKHTYNDGSVYGGHWGKCIGKGP